MYGRLARNMIRMPDPRPNADRLGAGVTVMSEGRGAIIPILDQFQRDILRMIAMLFGPMLVGAIVIPLLMMIFEFMGYDY
jgi:hypothetical protein